jgi:hypothetical protein
MISLPRLATIDFEHFTPSLARSHNARPISRYDIGTGALPDPRLTPVILSL